MSRSWFASLTNSQLPFASQQSHSLVLKLTGFQVSYAAITNPSLQVMVELESACFGKLAKQRHKAAIVKEDFSSYDCRKRQNWDS